MGRNSEREGREEFDYLKKFLKCGSSKVIKGKGHLSTRRIMKFQKFKQARLSGTLSVLLTRRTVELLLNLKFLSKVTPEILYKTCSCF